MVCLIDPTNHSIIGSKIPKQVQDSGGRPIKFSALQKITP